MTVGLEDDFKDMDEGSDGYEENSVMTYLMRTGLQTKNIQMMTKVSVRMMK